MVCWRFVSSIAHMNTWENMLVFRLLFCSCLVHHGNLLGIISGTQFAISQNVNNFECTQPSARILVDWRAHSLLQKGVSWNSVFGYTRPDFVPLKIWRPQTFQPLESCCFPHPHRFIDNRPPCRDTASCFPTIFFLACNVAYLLYTFAAFGIVRILRTKYHFFKSPPFKSAQFSEMYNMILETLSIPCFSTLSSHLVIYLLVLDFCIFPFIFIGTIYSKYCLSTLIPCLHVLKYIFRSLRYLRNFVDLLTEWWLNRSWWSTFHLIVPMWT